LRFLFEADGALPHHSSVSGEQLEFVGSQLAGERGTRPRRTPTPMQRAKRLRKRLSRKRPSKKAAEKAAWGPKAACARITLAARLKPIMEVWVERKAEPRKRGAAAASCGRQDDRLAACHLPRCIEQLLDCPRPWARPIVPRVGEATVYSNGVPQQPRCKADRSIDASAALLPRVERVGFGLLPLADDLLLQPPAVVF
jgi:hypothetical protein